MKKLKEQEELLTLQVIEALSDQISIDLALLKKRLSNLGKMPKIKKSQ